MTKPRVGFLLPPCAETLAILEDVVRTEPDYYSVSPETLWYARPDAPELELHPNGYHRRFEELRRETGKPFVAHGVGLSVGTVPTKDEERRHALWKRAIAHSHSRFAFQWYTDHLGASTLDGNALALPLPLRQTAADADRVRARLESLLDTVPIAGVENSAWYFGLGRPLEEPAFLARCLDGPRLALLLDLHNLYTNARNLGFDARAWLERAPLERVIEIHLSGGAESDPAWLPSGASLRLDSHDDAVPDEVWALLDEVLPRCPHLRGVTLERMEKTVHDAEQVAGELRRVRAAVEQHGVSSADEPPWAGVRRRAGAGESGGDATDEREFERELAALLLADDPAAALADLPAGRREAFARTDPDGLRIAALLVVKLRFERTLQGAPSAGSWFERDPGGFTEHFRRYHREVPPTALLAQDEGARFEAWLEAERRSGESPGRGVGGG